MSLALLLVVLTIPASASTASTKVVCFGDSITKRGYPEIMGRLLGVEAINSGVAGNTPAQALRRMAEDVFSHHPDVVVIFFGTNDSRVDDQRVHVPLEKYRANLKAMLSACRKNDARAILCTIPPIDPGPYFKRHKKADSRRTGSQPFFAYISLNAAHSPYVLPEEYYRHYLGKPEVNDTIARFFGMIENIDTNFGALLEKLDERMRRRMRPDRLINAHEKKKPAK